MTFVGPSSNDLSYLKKLTRQRVLRDRTTMKADPIFFENISSLARHYKDMSPGVAYALARQGIGPGKIADKVYQLDAKANISRPGKERQARLPRNLRDLTLHQISKITDSQFDSFSESQKRIIKKRAENLLEDKFGGGFDPFDIGGVVQRNLFDPIERNVLEPAIGEIQKNRFTQEIVKPTINTITTGLQAGAEGTVGASRAGWDYLLGGPFNEDTNNPAEQLSHIPKQTTAYQAWVKGLSTGEGFFPNPESPAGRAQAAAARKYSPYLIGGHAWTPGRALANTVFEPDDDAFRLASGLVDAGVALKLDPANVLLDTTSKIRQARRLWQPDALADAKVAAGAISGYRKLFAPRRFSNVVQSHGFAKTLNALAQETNPRKIAENLHLPMYLADNTPIAHLLSEAKTPEDVVGVLQKYAGSGLAEIPKWRPPVLSSRLNLDANNPLAVAIRTGKHLMTDVPRKYVYAGPNADLDATWRELDNSLINVHASEKARDRVARAWAAVGAPQSPPPGGWTAGTKNMSQIERQRAAMGVFFDTIEEQIKTHGIAEDIIGHARKKFNDEWLGNQTLDLDYKMEPVIQTRVVKIGPDGKPVPHPIDAETLLGWTVELPDPRALRKEVSMARKMLNHPITQMAEEGIDTLMDIWRKSVLTRPATALRVVGEEQMRIAAMGYNSGFRHPLSWAAYALGNPDERWVETLRSHAFTRGLGERLEKFRDAHGMRPYVLGEFDVDSDFFRDTFYETRFGAIANNRSTKLRLSGFDTVERNHALAPLALADELTRMRSSAIYRSVALNGVEATAWDLQHGKLSHLPLRNQDDYTTIRPAAVGERQPSLEAETIGESIGRENAPTFEWGGGGVPREQMQLGSPEISVASQAQAQAVADAIKNITGNHPKLTEAITTGRINGHQIMRYNNKPNKAALKELKRIIEEDDLKVLAGDKRVLPDVFRIDNWHMLPKTLQEKGIRRLDNAMNALMENVLTRPSNYFSRNPMLQQSFLDEVKRVFPYMGHEDRSRVLSHLADANLPKADKEALEYMHTRLTGIEDYNKGPQKFLSKANYEAKRKAGMMPIEHQLDYDTAMLYAKRRAVKQATNLLYDLSRRSQFFDMTRAIFPFGEAFKEVATRWARLTWENPRVIRRLQQGVTAARSSGSRVLNEIQGIPQPLDENGNPTGGFFYKDQFGQESFAFPGSSLLTKAVIGAPIPLKGSVQGLNIVGTGLPGLGPVVQIPLAYLLPDKPSWDWFRSKVFPFGDPRGEGFFGKVATALAPGWASKIEQAVFGNPDFDRIYASSVIDMARYLESTGKYKLQGPNAEDEVNRLLSDSKRAAKQLAITRGFGQFVLPTSPSPEWLVHDIDGKLTMQFALAKWYRRQLEKPGMDYAKAGEAFIDRFGINNFLTIQPKSKATIPGPVTSTEFDWDRNHPDIRHKYPKVYRLFAPVGKDAQLDQRAFEAQFNRGERQALTPEQAIRLANGRIASIVYTKAHDALMKSGKKTESGGEKIDEGEQYALRKLRQSLTLEFPGYNEHPVDFAQSDILINELTKASKDPYLRRTEAGKALRTYLHFRSQMQQEAEKQGYASFKTSRATAPYRTALNKIGEQLVRRYPSFQPMWDSVFRLEVD